jgi:hypothetical protein
VSDEQASKKMRGERIDDALALARRSVNEPEGRRLEAVGLIVSHRHDEL